MRRADLLGAPHGSTQIDSPMLTPQSQATMKNPDASVVVQTRSRASTLSMIVPSGQSRACPSRILDFEILRVSSAGGESSPKSGTFTPPTAVSYAKGVLSRYFRPAIVEPDNAGGSRRAAYLRCAVEWPLSSSNQFSTTLNCVAAAGLLSLLTMRKRCPSGVTS